MRRFLVYIVALAILIAPLPPVARSATDINDGSQARGQLKGTLGAGLYEPDSTGRVFKSNTYGHQYVSEGLKDRDHWEFKNTGFQGDSIPAASWAKYGIVGGYGLTFADLKDYSAASLMVSWTANADTDSVAVEIFVVGKQSMSEDGYDYVFDADDADTLMSGFFVGRGQWAERLWTKNLDRLSRRAYFAKPRSTQASLTEWDNNATPAPIGTPRTYQLGQLSGTGVMIPLTDIAGSDMLMPITGVWVVNRHPRRPIVGFNVNLWAKVK